ncbi:ABC transporter substrate-binding protein [Yinghuangia soli]|uniref:non-specific serine/threonine protein kinase n=1 Tax=Yinghuangia soli TaxID=2908204 RepID=A0AA41Q3R3_9ACTN|nr:ABC transporter substrate-binding protein [Yinghuangia soli]MCF2530993.1 ABC transporter substrate-binding protein [Yinghuangia soli]
MGVDGVRVLAGRYELVRFVGRGGMGEVWEGRDRMIERRVAVKILPNEPGDSSGSALFFREARTAGALHHPGVVTVFDLGQDETDGSLFLVMEFLDGRDLAALLRASGAPPVEVAVDWAAQAAAALARAHGAGIVHRDLKPANLLLTSEGQIKILDFGIARFMEHTNQSSKVMGTLAYMPPERFDEHPGDTRSDLYSLGCVLHELLTGKVPFEASGPVAMMNAHLTRVPDRPGEHRPGVPEALDDLVLRMLAKAPEDRPASADEVAHRLRTLGASAAGSPAAGAAALPPASGGGSVPARPTYAPHVSATTGIPPAPAVPATPPPGIPAPPPGAPAFPPSALPTMPGPDRPPAAPMPGWQQPGFPPPVPEGKRGRLRTTWVAAGTAMVLVAGGLTAALINGGGGDDDPSAGPSDPVTPVGDKPGESFRTGGSIAVALREPPSLVPTNVYDSEGSEVLNALFAGLVDYETDTGKTVPRVAESVTTRDNKEWTVKLKPGWKFHNGEPVTAGSFVDAWNYGANQANDQKMMASFAWIEGSAELSPGPGKAPASDKLKGLKVIDDATFTVTLTTPYAQFDTMLGNNAFYPLPKAFFTDPKAFAEAPIGNGPFQMDGRWEHNTQIKVKRFDGYGDPAHKARLDAVTFRIHTSAETAYVSLRAGTVDIMDQVPATAMPSVAADFRGRTSTKPEAGISYLGLPIAQNPALANPDLRKAISMAIDRKALAGIVFPGTRIPADDFVSPTVPGYRKGACEACAFDAAKAKALFDQAGGLPGNKLELAYNTDGAHKEWIEAVAAMLKANLGIEATPKPFDNYSNLLQAVLTKQYNGAFRTGWTLDYPSIENYLGPLFRQSAMETGANYSGYASPSFEAAMNTADRARGDDAVKAYQVADDIVLKDMPYIPLFFSQATNAWSTKVTNVAVDAQGHIRLELVSLA